MEKKTSEARLRASKKYSNSKWRPNVYIDKDKQESIEKWIADHGYKSFNEYVCDLIDKDMGSETGMGMDIGMVEEDQETDEQ